MRLLVFLVLLLPACAVLRAPRMVPVSHPGDGARARAPYVGKWDTKPSWNFTDATLELNADGSFEVVAFGSGSGLRGTWRPVAVGVELCAQSEEGVWFIEEAIRPPRLTLCQEADDLLDARPVPTGGARHFERREPFVEVAAAPVRDITALSAIGDALNAANLTWQMDEADGHKRHYEVRTSDADQARRLLSRDPGSRSWVVGPPADVSGPSGER